MSSHALRQFAQFAAVGAAGFVVDLGVLMLTAPQLGWYVGRCMSFLAAASFTWALNRAFTFASSQHNAGAAWRQYLRYLQAMAAGAAINYGTYVLTMHWFQNPTAPVLGVALGSAVGLAFNFFSARMLVFQASPLPTLRPLSDWPLDARRRIRGVFTDIDDTLTTAGTITDDALAALHDLRAAGIPVIAITGRAVGWCMPKVQAWPVLAMGAEAGAVLLLPPAPGSAAAPEKRYPNDAATRARHRQRLQEVSDQVLGAMPGLQIAPGAEGRETDIAFDHHEHAQLSPEDLARVRQLLLEAGLTVAVSSIHIHGCVEPHDKFLGACWIVRELFGRELRDELDQWAFVGDSANDEAMFRAFPRTSVGVANVRDGAGGLQHWPAFITPSPRGTGFAEAARALLAAR